MNVKLLRKVRKLIAEEPRRLDMGSWGERIKPANELHPPCGTVACLAGWTVLAATPKKKWNEVFLPPEGIQTRPHLTEMRVRYKAAELLDIPEWDCPFMKTGWGVKEILDWIDARLAEAKVST